MNRPATIPQHPEAPRLRMLTFEEERTPVADSIHFVTRQDGPERLLAEAEIHFGSGILAGMKLVGFSLWQSPDGDLYATFPSRAFGAGSDRRYFDFVRSVDGEASDARKVKAAILDAWRVRNIAHVQGERGPGSVYAGVTAPPAPASGPRPMIPGTGLDTNTVYDDSDPDSHVVRDSNGTVVAVIAQHGACFKQGYVHTTRANTESKWTPTLCSVCNVPTVASAPKPAAIEQVPAPTRPVLAPPAPTMADRLSAVACEACGSATAAGIAPCPVLGRTCDACHAAGYCNSCSRRSAHREDCPCHVCRTRRAAASSPARIVRPAAQPDATVKPRTSRTPRVTSTGDLPF